MAIIYPLAFPDITGIVSVQISPVNVVGKTRSIFTGQQQVVRHQGQWWEILVNTPTMERAKAEEWVAFFTSLKGVSGTFLFGDPFNKTPRGIGTGSPQVDGASQTGEDLNTKGWTASQTGIMLKGDWIQLGSGASSKLHKCLTDVNSDSGGLATLTVWPEIITSPADSATITVNSPQGVFRLKDNAQPWDINIRGHYKFSFAAMEAL